jgi:hypothetical protein
MFKGIKTTRRVRRAPSPMRVSTVTDISGNTIVNNTVINTNPPETKDPQFEKSFTTFFNAESAAATTVKPWLRLERGLRLQKYRAYALAYPGLTEEEQDALYRVLVKANDAKLLNTKLHIVYDNGVIQAVKGLKVIRTGDPTVPAVFKIEVPRATKKNTDES